MERLIAIFWDVPLGMWLLLLGIAIPCTAVVIWGAITEGGER